MTAGPVTLAGGEVREVEIRLPGERTLEVLVVDAETGRGIRSAKVRIEERGTIAFGEEALIEERGSGLSISFGGFTGNIRADRDGRAHAKALPAGSLEVIASHEEYVGIRLTRFQRDDKPLAAQISIRGLPEQIYGNSCFLLEFLAERFPEINFSGRSSNRKSQFI